MKNDRIPPNPHPVKPPPNMPEPRKESLEAENARLKAEVERLKEGNECLNAFHDKEMERSAYLCEQVERLRKAGDDMASSIQFNEEMEKDYDGPTIVHPSVERWNAAKEGKPSEQKSPSFIEDLGNGVEKHDLLFRYPAKEGKPSV